MIITVDESNYFFGRIWEKRFENYTNFSQFLSANGQVFERLTNMEYKLLEHDKKFDIIFNQLQHEESIKQRIFFQGQIYDAYSLIVDIIKKANKKNLIIDNYIDDNILKMLTKKKNDVGNTESYDRILSLTMSFYELEPTDSISIIKHLTALFYLSSYDNAIKANIGDKWKDKLIALLSSSELRKLFKYNILKDKQEGASRVFIAIDEKLYAFYNIRLGNKLVKQLLPDKIFLNKDDYHDPLKNIKELLFSL